MTGAEFEIKTRAVVDATGVWAAEPDHAFGSGSLRILPSRGAHLVVPRERIPNRHGLTIRVPGKIVFLVPWPDHWLIGTTDAPYEGASAHPSADGWEVDLLLATVNATMDVDLRREDIVGTYAGLRPLIAPSGGSTVKASREHRVTVERTGVVRIGGGKYTTYRVMARDVIDAVLGKEAAKARPSQTADRRLVGAADPDALARIAAELETIPAIAAIGPEAASRLVSRHGTEAPGVASLGAEQDLVRPLVPGPAVPRGRGDLGRAPRARPVARRHAGAPDEARPGAPGPRRGDRAAGRRAPRHRARLGRDPASPRGGGVPGDGAPRILGRRTAARAGVADRPRHTTVIRASRGGVMVRVPSPDGGPARR